jgi:S-DNA-T family DNA segregation ATPase FtsK/SpoIIIE
MAKKKTDKETEPKKISKNRFTTFFKSETTHFVIGLISVIFSVYLLLAFISFFFTGAADQSILDNQQPGELMQTTNHVKNYAGARGAQLAEFLINECFGIAACFIILFLAVAGMKMIKAYQFRVWKWFMSCSILLVWFSITLGFIFDGTFSDSFIYPGGLHGYNVSAWLVSQIGMPGLGLLLLITALLFFVYLSSETINMIPISKGRRKIPPQQPTMRTMIPVSNLKGKKRKNTPIHNLPW